MFWTIVGALIFVFFVFPILLQLLAPLFKLVVENWKSLLKVILIILAILVSLVLILDVIY